MSRICSTRVLDVTASPFKTYSIQQTAIWSIALVTRVRLHLAIQGGRPAGDQATVLVPVDRAHRLQQMVADACLYRPMDLENAASSVRRTRTKKFFSSGTIGSTWAATGKLSPTRITPSFPKGLVMGLEGSNANTTDTAKSLGSPRSETAIDHLPPCKDTECGIGLGGHILG